MEEDLQRLAVSSQDDKLGLSSVEGLGSLVSSLPQLLVVACLLNQVKDLSGESLESFNTM